MEQMRAEIKDHISWTYGPSAWKEVLQIEAEMRRKRKQELYRKQEQVDAMINFAIGATIFVISGGHFICYFLLFGQMAGALVMWVLLWLQVISGSFDHYHVGSYSSEEACKEAQKEAKVLVTNQNSKVVCIEIKR